MTITLDPGEDGSVDPASIDVPYGQSASAAGKMLPTPVRQGYQFGGWLNADGTSFDANVPLTDDVALHAEWNEIVAEKFTVSFDSAGGTEVDSQQVTLGDKAARPQDYPPADDPMLAHHTFEGWFADGANESYDFENTPVTNSFTLTARWTPDTHTVAFLDGYSDEPIGQSTLTCGSSVDRPQDPTREGYVFLCWPKLGTDGVEPEPYDFSQSVKEDTTLVALWVKLCTVIFDSAGGGTVEPQVVEESGLATDPGDPDYDEYHSFEGWYAPDASESFDFQTPIEDDLTLTARWRVATHMVTFDTGNGGSNVNEQPVEHGRYATKPADPVKDGCTFRCWYVDDDAVPYDFTEPVTADLTLHAAWHQIPVTYNVFFDSNGGSEVDAQSVAAGELVEPPLDPTKDNMRFAGWYVAGEDGPYDFASPVTNDLIITAHWTTIPEPSNFTVTLQVNKRTWTDKGTWADNTTADKTQTVQEGSCASEPESNPTRNNYVFDGWYELIPEDEVEDLLNNPELADILWSDGSDTLAPYNYGSPITGNTVLRARWRGVPHTVTFNTQGGSEISPMVKNHGERLGSVDRPTKDGCYLVGWSTVEGNLTTIVDPHFLLVNKDMTLYANWATFFPMHVDFDSNNGDEKTRQDVAFFDQVSKPSDPRNEGHTLDGWFEVLSEGFISPEEARRFWGSDPDFESKIHFEYIDGKERVLKRYNFAMPVVHDFELRAQWNADVCAVTFMSGDEVVDEQEVTWASTRRRYRIPTNTGMRLMAGIRTRGARNRLTLATRRYPKTLPCTRSSRRLRMRLLSTVLAAAR